MERERSSSDEKDQCWEGVSFSYRRVIELVRELRSITSHITGWRNAA